MGYAFDPGLDIDCLYGVLFRVHLSESEFEPKLFAARRSWSSISYGHSYLYSAGTNLDGQPHVICDPNEYPAAHIYTSANQHSLFTCPSHPNTSPNQHPQSSIYSFSKQCGKHTHSS